MKLSISFLSILNHQRILSVVETATQNAQDQKKKRVFVWHFRDRAKYGGGEYMTTLPVNMCEEHFAKLLEKNEGKKPMAVGWDEWEALDSILYMLDEEAPVYETMEEQLQAIEPLLQSGLLSISLPQIHNAPPHTH